MFATKMVHEALSFYTKQINKHLHFDQVFIFEAQTSLDKHNLHIV